jgi:acyl-CoA thioesterase
MTEQAAPESTLERMIAIFDVTPTGTGPSGLALFTGESDGGGRNVVDGSQMLAQSIVAAGKAFPGRTVRSAHSLFVAAANPHAMLEFTVTPVRAGRSFASAVVTASQGDRTNASTTVLLDYPQPDVIRHDHPAGSPEAGPEESHPSPMPLTGRELRIAGVRERDSADEVGPPVMDAWLRYAAVPERAGLRRALLAHFTGQLSISTTFRAHAGIGTAQAHYTVSTAPMGIGISFHEPVAWDGWIRYHHESTYAGAGMSYVRGQVLTADGRLMASFTQDAMIRGFDDNGAQSAIPVEARLLPGRSPYRASRCSSGRLTQQRPVDPGCSRLPAQSEVAGLRMVSRHPLAWAAPNPRQDRLRPGQSCRAHNLRQSSRYLRWLP